MDRKLRLEANSKCGSVAGQGFGKVVWQNYDHPVK